MWKDEIRKNIFEKEAEKRTGVADDLLRKVGMLERMREQILEYYGIISSFEFQKGFPKDGQEDIAEAAKLLEKASDLMDGFMQ